MTFQDANVEDEPAVAWAEGSGEAGEEAHGRFGRAAAGGGVVG